MEELTESLKERSIKDNLIGGHRDSSDVGTRYDTPDVGAEVNKMIHECQSDTFHELIRRNWPEEVYTKTEFGKK